MASNSVNHLHADVFHELELGTRGVDLLDGTRLEFVQKATKYLSVPQVVVIGDSSWASFSKDLGNPGQDLILLCLLSAASSLKI